MYQDIKERTFKYSLRIIDLSTRLPRTFSGAILGKQVLRSGTSIGANIEEAVAAYGRNDFIYKLNLALQEARETHYWLRLVEASSMLMANQLCELIGETEEIKNILGAIVSKLKKEKFKSQK
ncbi:MAG TPA: four helix bundle protein [Bacteroidota bacterium]|nr:four helix bundle protein [Bacteroidota bacterium]